MIYQTVIPYKLPGLNEYTGACRANRFAGAQMKKRTQALILPYLKDLPEFTGPVSISCLWTDGNARRDIDNVAFAVKFILDALQAAGKLPNDNRKFVREIAHSFNVDKETKSYSVTVTITEL